MEEIKENTFFITILGFWQVGKSSMISSLFGLPFDDNILPTRGLDYTYNVVQFENKEYKFKICDTIGGTKYRKISSSTIPIADGFLLVFSLDLRRSFEELKYWLQIINEKININEKAVIIVGNKSDTEKRVISYEEASNFADLYKLKYFETSALTGNNIQNVFNELYNDIYIKCKEAQKKLKNKKVNINFIENLTKYYKN